jgi:hypothetical protein
LAADAMGERSCSLQPGLVATWRKPLPTVGTSLARSHAMALTLAILAFGLFCFVLADQLVRRS